MAKRNWKGALNQWKRAAGSINSAIASTFSALVGAGYAALDPKRKIMPRGMSLRSYSANELANLSLPQLRTLCRKLERDNPTARAVVEGLTAQVVGTGIALEPDTGDPTTDARLRVEWQNFIQGCDVTGEQSLYDLQILAFRETVIAGEFIWRDVVLPERLNDNKLPLAILPLESEWLSIRNDAIRNDGLTHVNGIILDKLGRPVHYILINPDPLIAGDPEIVDAAHIHHGFERRRAMQNRGEPWLAPVIERLWQEGDLVDTELRAAVVGAGIAVVVTSQFHDTPDTTEDGTTDDPAAAIGIGSVARLHPGEDAKAFSSTRPSQLIAPFRQTLRGDIAASTRLDQRWLDRDYSRANYSSLRAAMLDNERLLKPVREWFGHATAGKLYLRVLPYLCAKAGIKLPKNKNYRLIPDGQPYVDPVKDVLGATAAINAGLSNFETEIGKRGGDYKEVWKQAAKEREEIKQLGLVLDLSGTNAPQPDSTIKPENEADDEEGKDNATAVAKTNTEIGRSLQLISQALKNDHRQVVVNPTIHVPAPIVRNEISAPTIHVSPTPINVSAPTVNVAQPEIRIDAPIIRNEIAAQSPPIINVAAPTVNVAAPNVTVDNEVIVPQRTIKAIPQRDGSVLMEPQG